MAWDHHRLDSEALLARGESGQLIAPEHLAGRILNMELTQDGTLRSIVGPVEYTPTEYHDGVTPQPGPETKIIDYRTPMAGIFHCLLEGGRRDVLLGHFNDDFVGLGGTDGIWVYHGWASDLGGWNLLISGSPTAELPDPLAEADNRFGWNTQFEATPNGVVIIPQGSRTYFYDGTTIAPLGFEDIPAPPEPAPTPLVQIAGTTDSANDITVSTEGGFILAGRDTQEAMGHHRLGSVSENIATPADGKLSNPFGGVLLGGEWRTRLQLQGHWGNLSAPSPPSGAFHVYREDNLTLPDHQGARVLTEVAATQNIVGEASVLLKKQAVWMNLDKGPSHCVAKSLYRTKDLLNSGDSKYYWLSPSATGDQLAFATMHGRLTELFPDNIPDSWLRVPLQEVMPFPRAKLCCLFAGRMWYAHTDGDPGLLVFSEPGFWGTVLRSSRMYPDASGSHITGLWSVANGLLVFTTDSTYLVRVSDDGQGFRQSRVSPTVGCVAPDSIKTLPGGLTVWLGHEGFYGYDGQSLQPLTLGLQASVISRINWAWAGGAVAAIRRKMGVYRCWFPIDGKQANNFGLEFDGQHWRELDYVDEMHAVCSTRDSRDYMIAQAKVTTSERGSDNSVWLLDHEGSTMNNPTTKESMVESVWLRSSRTRRRGSPVRLSFMMRETGTGKMTIEVMRDWREAPLVATPIGAAPLRYAEDDTPAFWGTTLYNSTFDDKLRSQEKINYPWVSRRPYWTKVDLHVPSCEVFKVRIKYTGDWEFLGLRYEENDMDAGGARIPAQGGR